jgi:hypothetical protein
MNISKIRVFTIVQIIIIIIMYNNKALCPNFMKLDHWIRLIKIPHKAHAIQIEI